jgi:glutathione S-transferase
VGAALVARRTWLYTWAWRLSVAGGVGFALLAALLLELEKQAPTPPLLPVGREGEARGLAMWIDHNIPWAAGEVAPGAMADQLPEAFKKDRSEFTGRSFDSGTLKAAVPVAREKAYVHFAIAEQILRDGRPYLLGAAPSVADCALYNPVWFLQSRLGQESTPAPLDRLPKIVGWWERMKAFGNGKPADLPSAEALDIAKGATPKPTKVDQSDPSGLKAGQKISVVPDDTGKVPVSGTLIGLAPDRVSIIRSDPRVGEVVVHFPRAGYVIAPL